jgi:hypothetical protein
MEKLNVKQCGWTVSTANLDVMKMQEAAGVYRICDEFWFKNKEECTVSINGSEFGVVEAGMGIYFENGGVDSFVVKEANKTFYFRYTYR